MRFYYCFRFDSSAIFAQAWINSFFECYTSKSLLRVQFSPIDYRFRHSICWFACIPASLYDFYLTSRSWHVRFSENQFLTYNVCHRIRHSFIYVALILANNLILFSGRAQSPQLQNATKPSNKSDTATNGGNPDAHREYNPQRTCGASRLAGASPHPAARHAFRDAQHSEWLLFRRGLLAVGHCILAARVRLELLVPTRDARLLAHAAHSAPHPRPPRAAAALREQLPLGLLRPPLTGWLPLVPDAHLPVPRAAAPRCCPSFRSLLLPALFLFLSISLRSQTLSVCTRFVALVFFLALVHELLLSSVRSMVAYETGRSTTPLSPSRGPIRPTIPRPLFLM